ncbi:RNase A-like domain-containing protein [Achromobacter sp.]|uniref:RNase A-like domain-containing protein n=1 Tax=Achromobacter sp. TaxID=134375 RepID=UPI003C793055
MTEDSGVSIALTPVQLAAILHGESIGNEATLSNRMWGGLTLVAGLAEMVGGAALCVVPEPTGLTKAGCVLLGAHGSDTATTGLYQMWTGQQAQSLTARGLTELATKHGATPGSGRTLGLAVEIAVPVGFAGAVKAARVSSVIAGRISLSRHEASILGGVGGHTLAKHVEKTKAFLEARLRAEPRLPAASTFHSIAAAEQAVNALMRRQSQTVATWAASAHNGDKLGLSGPASGNLGVVLVRGATTVVEGTVVRVALKKQTYNGMPYFVLTAYLATQ